MRANPFVRLLASCLFVLAAAAQGAWAAPRVKVIKLAVTNPSDAPRAGENVVVKVADLKRVVPDFKPAAFVVTTSDAATVEEDAAVIQTTELASQADDIDGDGKPDEIAFQIELKPRQTRVVNIAYGDAATTPSSTR